MKSLQKSPKAPKIAGSALVSGGGKVLAGGSIDPGGFGIKKMFTSMIA